MRTTAIVAVALTAVSVLSSIAAGVLVFAGRDSAALGE